MEVKKGQSLGESAEPSSSTPTHTGGWFRGSRGSCLYWGPWAGWLHSKATHLIDLGFKLLKDRVCV